MSKKQAKNKTAETEETGTGTPETETETPETETETPSDETAEPEEETAEASGEDNSSREEPWLLDKDEPCVRPSENEEQPSEGLSVDRGNDLPIFENNSVENEQPQDAGEASDSDGCLSADYDRVQGGATCPNCSTPKAKVTTTCPWKEGTRVRYHDCQTCGARIKSIERDVPENLFAVAAGQEQAQEAPPSDAEERRGFRSNPFHPLARG